MLRLRLRGFAGVLATAFVITQAPMAGVAAMASPMSAQEWLDTIRVPVRDDGPQVGCPDVGAIDFKSGMAELSADGRRSLDALATTLTSADLEASRFHMLWLAGAGESKGLAERRVGVVEADLRSRPALSPGRLTIQPAAALEDCPRLPSANALLLQVRIAGRWWGGP